MASQSGQVRVTVRSSAVVESLISVLQLAREFLHGIDAPESGQYCSSGDKKFRCGQLAAMALDQLLGDLTITCEPKDRDHYGRIVAVCRAAGVDINAWMVSAGWAMAFRRRALDYVKEEEAASASRRGLWQTEFQPPWEWRRQQRAETKLKQP